MSFLRDQKDRQRNADAWLSIEATYPYPQSSTGPGHTSNGSNTEAPVLTFVRMRKSSISLVVAFLLTLVTGSLSAAIDVVIETKIFHIGGTAPRVEVNMAIIGGSMALEPNAAGLYQAHVEVVTLIEQAGAIKTFAKSKVLGPATAEPNYGDVVHQEFFDLTAGSYDLIVEVRDLMSADTTVHKYRSPLVIATPGSGIGISNILLAERIEPAANGELAKYGYKVVPLLSDYYPTTISSLDFYAEVYGTEEVFGKDSLFLLTYQLESYEKKTVHGSFRKNVRARAKPVEPVMAQFDISNLPSGNYVLAIEVRDRKGELIARRDQMIRRNHKVEFNYDLQSMDQLDLSNTFAGALMDRDTLAEHINSMRPIADPLERKIIDDRRKDRDLELMRRFFYSFWSNRSVDPERAWKEYRDQVVIVNKMFGCRVQKGYENDRGLIYLKYGAPNSMMDRLNEMDSYPYTIWHYYQAGRYRDKRFVFYQPALGSDCFELLHSEVPGELNNPRWNQMLHSRNVPMQNVDPQNVNTISGDRAREFFDMPR